MSEEKLTLKALEALKHIRNGIMRNGKVPTMRELMGSMSYKSPRSAMLLMEELSDKGFLIKRSDNTYKLINDIESGENIRTVLIPLVGSVACGSPLLAEENIEAMIPVSTSLAKAGSKYFLLKAKGDSMNEAGINDGDIILIKQQPIANNGDHIVALIDDEATVKEFRVKGDIVTLLPRSTNPKHQQIILTSDFFIQGVVITTIPNYS